MNQQQLQRLAQRAIDSFPAYSGHFAVHSARWRYQDQPEPGDSLYCGDLEPLQCKDLVTEIASHLASGNNVYFLPDYLSGSDYSGSTVERSNYRVFSANFSGDEYEATHTGSVEADLPVLPYVHQYYGGHGTYGIAINVLQLSHESIRVADLDDENQSTADDYFQAVADMLEALNSLDDYPVLDEQDISFYEMEAADDDWSCWCASDYRRELERRYENIGLEVTADDDQLRSVFENIANRCNVYWEPETGGGMYIDLQRIVDDTSLDDLAEHWQPTYLGDRFTTVERSDLEWYCPLVLGCEVEDL